MSKYNYEELIEQIKNMGIKPSDTVIIHSSMKSIGDVEGGADTVIDAFKDYLAEEGLLLIPALTYKETRKTLLFDIENTVPCIGIIPTLAIKRKDGIRSINPTHSIMAFGKKAEEYVAGEENLISPTAKGGCFDRLADVNAKILLIRVGQERNTFIHAIDEINNLHRVSNKVYQIKTKLKDGSIIDTPHHPLNHTKEDLSVSHHFPKFERILFQKGAIKYNTFGDAKVQVCDAKRMKEVIEELIRLNPGYDLFMDDNIPNTGELTRED